MQCVAFVICYDVSIDTIADAIQSILRTEVMPKIENIPLKKTAKFYN